MPGDPSQLFPEEALQVAGAVEKRVREFAAGRSCARRAFAEFGIGNYPLLKRADRSPDWPHGLVGSITHSGGYCAAVVCRSELYRGIGIDAEIMGRIDENLWPHFCTHSELDWLENLPRKDRRKYAGIVFSAKEAFYKCQYTLTNCFLGFHDAQLDFETFDLNEGDCTISLHPGKPLLTPLPSRFYGRFHVADQLVITGFALPALAT